MSVLRRILGIRDPEHVLETVKSARDEDRVAEYESNIEGARSDLRQSLQKLESGTRVMRTMEGMIMMTRGHAQ